MKLVVFLLFVTAAFYFLCFYNPDQRGWKNFGELPRLPNGRYAAAEENEFIAVVLLIEVIEQPDYRWPLSSFYFSESFNNQKPYLVRGRILESFGTAIGHHGDIAVETRGTLKAGEKYLLCLDGTGAIIEGYQAEKDGTVRLIDTAAAKPGEFMAGNKMTDPMTPEEAAKRLLGQKALGIPTRFRP